MSGFQIDPMVSNRLDTDIGPIHMDCVIILGAHYWLYIISSHHTMDEICLDIANLSCQLLR